MKDTKIVWHKFDNNPVIPVIPNSWKDGGAMTSDILKKGNRYYFYYIGKTKGKDSLGLAYADVDKFDGVTWKDGDNNPILSPGPTGSFDSKYIVDPAAISIKDKLYLYYSGVGDIEDSIGLAISEDWKTFTKHPEPVLRGKAPEVVRKDNKIYMYYLEDNTKGGWDYHLALTEDGIHFKTEGPVFKTAAQGWDSFSVLTARIFEEDGIYIMSYAGDDEVQDCPKYFGHAFSNDLINWVRYPENPVLEKGKNGDWESKAIWFPEILKHGNKYYMYYEGNNGSYSQTGLATCEDSIAAVGKKILNN
jgi:predicted GH43/DUF377 family glycosyl hydrolase